MSEPLVSVQFNGREDEVNAVQFKPPFKIWKRGEIKEMPADLAKKILTNPNFRRLEAPKPPPPPQPTPDPPPEEKPLKTKATKN